ncbi:dna repair and recombination protein mitochondrial [Lasius niger]|uniref:Dna repair and recombination protein mitochondrial n=1 Tax=Lasius niger TaxID=67767 RepID=A0A0J7MRZ5_LASNI|nr:dna repair and recombination protein mitochondrial [Lasius niger]
MPPTCKYNKLEVLPVPQEIAILNDYERILIQQAKAFQTVQRMGTVMNKNLPHKDMVSKVKGRTFHLPLPMEETFKKICLSNEPINLNHELYILVRGIPTKANIVWEKLVDVKKVWDALLWLKHNNPIYSNIILPIPPENLLHIGLQNVEFQEEEYYEIDNKILDKEGEENDKLNTHKQEYKALLTQMSQTDQYYNQFTIYPMYEKRINESASNLYQMIKIHDVPLDNRYKNLDAKCFPNLFPFGINYK